MCAARPGELGLVSTLALTGCSAGDVALDADGFGLLAHAVKQMAKRRTKEPMHLDRVMRLRLLDGSGDIALVAAGVVLRGDQEETRASRSGNRLGTCGTAEGGEDAEDQCVSGEDAESNRGDDSRKENEGHQKRIHNLPDLFGFLGESVLTRRGPALREPRSVLQTSYLVVAVSCLSAASWS